MNMIFQVGEPVRVTSYSPFRGLRGTVRKVDAVSHSEESYSEEPFYFYLVTLEGSQIKEPVWFENQEVESLMSVESV
jgi:hypothetical protein